MDLTPPDIIPFVLALVAAFAAMMFARRHNAGGRPFSLVAAVLYAVAAGCFLLGIISWSTRLL